MRLKSLFALAVAALLFSSTPMVAHAAPAAASSAAPKATKGGAQADTGKTMQKVLSKLTLSADEKAKVDKIMADSSLKGAKRRDAVRAALTPANQTKFDQEWAATHHHKKSSSAPASSASPKK